MINRREIEFKQDNFSSRTQERLITKYSSAVLVAVHGPR